jgi:hypothetical protein
VNGTSNAAEGSDEMMEPSTSAAAATAPPTYDDLFPSLPMAAQKASSAKVGGGPIGDWNKKPVLSSSTVTQVTI